MEVLGFTVTGGHGVPQPCQLRGGSYLLLRSGEPLLDVDGQFPGGDTFPWLGHVGGVCGRQDQRGRGGRTEGEEEEEEGDPADGCA